MVSIQDLSDSTLIIETDSPFNKETCEMLKSLIKDIYEIRSNDFVTSQAIKAANDPFDDDEPETLI